MIAKLLGISVEHVVIGIILVAIAGSLFGAYRWGITNERNKIRIEIAERDVEALRLRLKDESEIRGLSDDELIHELDRVSNGK